MAFKTLFLAHARDTDKEKHWNVAIQKLKRSDFQA